MPSGYRAIETFEHLTERVPVRDRAHEAYAVEAARAALVAAEELYGKDAGHLDWAGAVGGFQAATADLLLAFERLQAFTDHVWQERAR